MAQAGQCCCRAAEVGASRCARGAQRDLQRRGHRQARVASKAFEIDYGAKYPKVVAKIVADADVLLEFYRDTPAEHWIHLGHRDPNRFTVYDRRASKSLVAIGYLDQRHRQSWPP